MRRVLLDVDGVIADFVDGYLSLVTIATGKRFGHEDVTEFDIGKALGLSDEEKRSVNALVMTGFCSGLRPLGDAVRGVAKLREVADVYVVTSPWNSCPTWTFEREQWLKRYVCIPHSRVLHGSAKHLVRADFLVDDKTDTLRAWGEAHPEGTAVLWDSPWNTRDGWVGAHTSDWGELRDLVLS